MTNGNVAYLIAHLTSPIAAYAAEKIIHKNRDKAEVGTAIAAYVSMNYAVTIFFGKAPLEPIRLMAICLGAQLVANAVSHLVEKIRSKWAKLGLAIAITPQLIKHTYNIIKSESFPSYLAARNGVCLSVCGIYWAALAIDNFFDPSTDGEPQEPKITITTGLAGSCAALLTTTLIATALKVKSPSLSLLI